MTNGPLTDEPLTDEPLTDEQRAEARAWIMAIGDQLAAVRSLAARAGDRFAGTALYPAFHGIREAVADLAGSSPAMEAARGLAVTRSRPASSAAADARLPAPPATGAQEQPKLTRGLRDILARIAIPDEKGLMQLVILSAGAGEGRKLRRLFDAGWVEYLDYALPAGPVPGVRITPAGRAALGQQKGTT